jgi:hypothetical protein
MNAPKARRWFSAVVAISLGLATWAITLPFIPEESWEGGSRLLATLLVAGIPVGSFLAWRMVDRVGVWHPLRLIGWLAVSAAVLGDLEITLIFAIAGMWGGEPVWVVLAPMVFVVGLFYAIFVLPMTLLAATAWYAAFRGIEWLANRIRSAGQAKGPGVAGA